ncbi:type VII secretion integral membrane protein EccD [Actinoplanes sp. TFC3]|uniref:type VII secretion integral membrane protein EccD n=1 Tax=Actinoplanes sp. TFC3 TaxID=1710355 RepID=UPI00082D29C3|nr:type VII secretion integral membrane protein EccD [Actinoplanes sp. TFC3]
MTTALDGGLCRITVIGPDRKIDLAVPATTSVAALLPVLLNHTTTPGRAPEGDAGDGAWVLQRLGEQPFELSGTPESLDWLEGEELYLRRAEDPLPELDFDDLAEGIATVVNRRNDRWQPEYRRVLFLLLSVVGMATIAAVLTNRGPTLPQVIGCGVVGAIFFVAALVCARKLPDGAFSLLFGAGSAGFVGLSASSAVDGDPVGIAINETSVLAFAVGVVAVVAVLLLCQRTVTPYLPPAPMLVAGVTALVSVGVLLLQSASQMTAQRTAASAVAIIFVVIVLAPRAAVKFARLRGPQLPKTGADMTYDIEPAPSDEVRNRTNEADTYLSVAMLTSALVLPVVFHYSMEVPGWAGWTYVLVVASAILLRARTFLGFWQRIALTLAGTVGVLMVIMRLSQTLTPGWRWVLLSALLGAMIPLVMAALRPFPRRMLPFWEYSATFFDVATGVAVLPVLAQILGLYVWARGLFG